MFGASHGRCGSVFWSLSGAEVHQPSDSRSAEVLEPSFLQENPAFRLRSMTGFFHGYTLSDFLMAVQNGRNTYRQWR